MNLAHWVVLLRSACVCEWVEVHASIKRRGLYQRGKFWTQKLPVVEARPLAIVLQVWWRIAMSAKKLSVLSSAVGLDRPRMCSVAFLSLDDRLNKSSLSTMWTDTIFEGDLVVTSYLGTTTPLQIVPPISEIESTFDTKSFCAYVKHHQSCVSKYNAARWSPSIVCILVGWQHCNWLWCCCG